MSSVSATQHGQNVLTNSLDAIKKDGGKRAVKVCSTMEEAQNLLPSYGAKHSIETRAGGDIRCERFCSVAPFCNYYKTKYQTHE